MIRSGKRVRNGFTLVEMLVVIVIIGILAALITAAAATALWSAKQTKIKVEVDQLAAAMEAFKQKYGSYPPANLSCALDTGQILAANPQLTAFIARAFPRYTVVSPNVYSLAEQIAYDLAVAPYGSVQMPVVGGNQVSINPQVALAFWLSGFTADPTDPFNRGTTSAPNLSFTRSPLFSFDQTRLLDVTTGYPVSPPIAGLTIGTPTGHMVYNAPYGNAAYCYFDYQTYGTLNIPPSNPPYLGQLAYPTLGATNAGIVYASTTPTNEVFNNLLVPFQLSNGTGVVMPYVFDTGNTNQFAVNDTFCKPTSFQIISAGQDGSFGTTINPAAQTQPVYGRLYPTGLNYDMPPTLGGSADDDNVTNFCEKSSLDAAKP